uniref:Uncharacterized protein n=1 Tax=Chlamydomonas euryale TaxID=1486919 RepID=A0A7R9V3C0_9CHLO|mmetsp:Transcript_17039/g.51073  ORF Transcript_17039/g.51073 Transcript_17039/m.51073 type:complete len:313 (+) Transcript_17039:1737-2675(+)|eukprot:47747-Chlamydomonas_euryale.AAC.8
MKGGYERAVCMGDTLFSPTHVPIIADVRSACVLPHDARRGRLLCLPAPTCPPRMPALPARPHLSASDACSALACAVGDRSAVDVLARELHALSHGRAGGGRDAEPSPAHPPSPPSGGVSAGGARRWAGRHALLTNTSLDSRRLSAAAAAVVGGSPLRSPFGAGGSGGGAARADDADGSVSPPQGRVWARHGPSCMSPPRSGGGGATRVSPGGEHGVANGASALIRMSTRSLHATLGSSFRAHTLVHGGSPAEGGLQSQTHEALQQLLGQHHAPLARRVHGMRYSMPGMMPLDDESGAGCGAAAAGSSSAGGA